MSTNSDNLHDTEATTEFELRVTMPRHALPEFLEAMTGHDDDIILAAERAMRDRIGAEDIEVWTDRIDKLDLQAQVAAERRCQDLYGPVA